MEPVTRDLSGFDKHVMNLFKICKKILTSQDSRSLSNRKNPLLVRLEKYEKTYTKTDPEEHVGYFERVYTDNKRFILLGPQRDSWLTDGGIVITFGEECGVKTEIKFYMSSIYNAALKLRDELTEESKGLPNLTVTSEQYYPDDFMLEMYHIFRELATAESEIGKLDVHLEELGGATSSKSNDPLSSLFDMASGMAEQVSGQKIPKDKMPAKNDIGKMLGSVMENPQTKSMLGNMMQEFQNSGNLGEMFTKMVGGLGAMGGQQPTTSGPQSDTLEDVPELEEGDVNDEFSE